MADPLPDFKVADLSLAGFGRKEIELAEHEMPGLMALRAEYTDGQPLAGWAYHYRGDPPGASVLRELYVARAVGGTRDAVPICARFGSRVQPGQRFCADCGSTLGAAARSPTPVADDPGYAGRTDGSPPDATTPIPDSVYAAGATDYRSQPTGSGAGQRPVDPRASSHAGGQAGRPHRSPDGAASRMRSRSR